MACANTITNGAPLVLFRGTEDQSERQVSVEPTPRPQHLPLFIVQTERGKLTPTIVLGGNRDLMYGSASFSETGIYTNHQTIGSNLASEAGNAHMIWRVSNGTYASLLLSLEVTDVDVPLYQRGADGKYIVNSRTGALVPVTGNPVVPGHLLRWVVSGTTSATVGAATVSTYTQSGRTTPTTVYPIMEVKAADPGAYGNNLGIRLYADTREGAVDTLAMKHNKAFPYRLSLMSRANATASPSFIPTISNERNLAVTFSPTSVIRPTGIQTSTYIGNVLKDQYDNTTDTRYPLRYSPFGDNIHVYQANIDTVVTEVGQAELAYLTSNPAAVTGLDTSLLQEPKGFRLMNIVSAKDHTDVPYYTAVLDEAELPGSSVRLTQFTTVYARGGADNIMSVEEYERAVVDIIARYGDCTDGVQDIARRPESIFYDTGFTLDTKLELAPFISQRPDLNLVLSTHEDSRQVRGYIGTAPAGVSKALTMSEEVAVASVLQNRIRLIPESEFYGTPTMRAIIFAGSGVLRNSEWKARVPVTMDMLYKASRYMGAADGRWNRAERFSRAPGNILTRLEDVTIPWVPVANRVRNWDVGINMALAYNEQFMAMPSQQTVYPDDTSILNSWLPTLAIAYLNKVCHAAWREYRGVDDLSDSELITQLNRFVSERIDGIWDSRFLVIPNAEITVDDEARGTSWHLNVKFGANNAKTVETVRITAYRRSDLETVA